MTQPDRKVLSDDPNCTVEEIDGVVFVNGIRVLKDNEAIGIDYANLTRDIQEAKREATEKRQKEETAKAIKLMRLRMRSSNAQPVVPRKTTRRNAPCPCGSGFKFKNCCRNK